MARSAQSLSDTLRIEAVRSMSVLATFHGSVSVRYLLPRRARFLVAQTGQVHGLLEGLAETVVLQRLRDGGLDSRNLREGLVIYGLMPEVCGHLAVKILVGQYDGTVDEVAVDSNQFGIIAGLEVLPGEIVVLGLGSIGAEHVAEHILLAGEVPQILVQPDGPVARGGEFVALEVEELVGRHVLRQDESVSVGFQHTGEDNAVEDDVVLADKV